MSSIWQNISGSGQIEEVVDVNMVDESLPFGITTSYQNISVDGTMIVGNTYKLEYTLSASDAVNLRLSSFSAFGALLDLDGSVGTHVRELECTQAATGQELRIKVADGSSATLSAMSMSIPNILGKQTGDKYWGQGTAGVRATQSKQAYGEWEWDMYKGADGNRYSVHFIADRTGAAAASEGYYIAMPPDEKFYLVKNNVGSANNVFVTTASYIDNNTDYRIKVTRTTDGEFTVYIKGGSFGNVYTLVDVTGGSGSNPVTDNTYTKSQYLVTDLDASDTFGNLLTHNQVRQ